MDCRRFRKHHPAFVDDNLPEVTLEVMRAHLMECAQCADHHARVRRALMVVRSSPPLRMTPEFRRRLATRLAKERSTALVLMQPSRWRQRVSQAAAAFALICVSVGGGFAIFGAARGPGARGVITASTPQRTLVAAVAEPSTTTWDAASSAMPVYGAMLLAQRAAEAFVAAQFHTIALTETH
jgi:anti-sigma factor RsiW